MASPVTDPSTTLLLSILTMDAYNETSTVANASKPYLALPNGSGIGTQIGGATVTDVNEIATDSFLGVVYSWNGSAVISFRGTDAGSDVVNGWTIFLGDYTAPEALDAAQLYQNVNGSSSNIILTGHSLGGALAGFVADVYDGTAVIFDNTPYEQTATNLYNASTLPGLDQDGQVVRPIDDPIALENFYRGTATSLSETGITAYATQGEIAQNLRVEQTKQITPLNDGSIWSPTWPQPIPNFSWTTGLVNLGIALYNGYELHSSSLLPILTYAQVVHQDAKWTPVSGFVVGELFDESIALAIGEQLAGTDGSADPVTKMQMMIAYSALPSGPYLYGDTAIVSLFQDADAFGTMENTSALAGYLKSNPVESAIAGIIDEYAGLLAINQDTNAQDESVFSFVPATNRMVIDFAPSRWQSPSPPGSSDGPKQINIVDQQTLITAPSALSDVLVGHAAAVHFVFQADYRWPAVMPGQAGMRRAALDDFIGKKWIEVVHGVDLRGGGIAPGEAERRHAPLHLAEHVTRLLAQPIRAGVAEPDDALVVGSVALLRLAAAGDDETGRGVRRGFGVGERME
ncbi:MAG TPA: hypothetical protein VHW69_11375 [Rhizomicrobium sp.]|nr:hypothetical protein [Rhizomicrobium sp.]